MANKNTTKETRRTRKSFPPIKLICIIFFLVGVIIFVQANVINVSGTKNGMMEVKYRYNYDGEKYEENVRQSVDEIKAGDKKEIRIRKSIPEKIITTTMTTAICNIIAFTLCFIASLGVLLAVVWLDEEKREGRF